MLRVLTWNVRNGGERDRLPRIREVLAGQRADVLALQELRGFDAVRAGAFAAELGMRAVLAGSRFGQPVALLFRSDLVVRNTFRLRRPLHHGAAGVTLETDAGPLTIIGTHLYPHSGWRRRIEAGWLATRARQARMVLLLGDLNTLDPGSDHAGELAALSPRYRRRHLTRSGRVDTRAVGVLHRAGLVDLFEATGAHGQRHTVPTPGPWGEEFARMRLDYAFASPDLAAYATACGVVDAGSASDHYPLLAEFELTG